MKKKMFSFLLVTIIVIQLSVSFVVYDKVQMSDVDIMVRFDLAVQANKDSLDVSSIPNRIDF